MLQPHETAGFHDNCSWIDISIIGTSVILDFLLCLVAPDLIHRLRVNDVKEITVSLL